MVQREPGLGVLTAHRLAVWGDPIAHSRSAQMHRAAYDALGRRLLDDQGIYRKQYRAPRSRPRGK